MMYSDIYLLVDLDTRNSGHVLRLNRLDTPKSDTGDRRSTELQTKKIVGFRYCFLKIIILRPPSFHAEYACINFVCHFSNYD